MFLLVITYDIDNDHCIINANWANTHKFHNLVKIMAYLKFLRFSKMKFTVFYH